MLNNEWLSKTYGYQSTHFGVDYRRMETDIEYRLDYIKTNALGMQSEIIEALDETPWKPWASGDKKAHFDDGRDRYVKELIDVLFFAANALTAAKVTDDELEQRYLAKMTVNQNRQRDGYDARSTKCATCARALDEPNAPEPVRANERLYCSTSCVVAAAPAA
jgi:hypothetical protein